MPFSQQQNVCAQRYGNKTRVGNWFEDLCLEKAKKKESDNQNHSKRAFEEKIRICTQKISSSCDNDGFLRYGGCIALMHKETGGTLACDPFDASTTNSEEFAASVCRSHVPMARNTFLLIPLDPEDTTDDIVRWGVPFQIACNPALPTPKNTVHDTMENPSSLFLSSCIKTEQRASPISCQQLVFMTHEKSSYNTHWVAHAPAQSKNSGATRLLNKGVPILVGESLVLQHCATKNFLTSDSNNVVVNDFGHEYEVCGDIRLGHGRVRVLRDEFSGSKTENTICRPELEQNIWSIGIPHNVVTGDKIVVPPLRTESILLKTMDILSHRGRFSVRVLHCKLKRIAGDRYPYVDSKEMKRTLCEQGVRLDDEQFRIIFDSCNETDREISVPDFIAILRGQMKDERKALIDSVYVELDVNEEGVLRDGIIMGMYNSLCCSDIHEQRIGFDNEDDFMALWDWNEHYAVTREAFLEFYMDLSSEVRDDDEFELFVQTMCSFHP